MSTSEPQDEDHGSVESEESTTLLPLSLQGNDQGSNGDTAFLSLGTGSDKLPVPLRVLFAFNGITLSLPMAALLYVINTRVAMPLAILPTYGAIAFMPFSLKPLYAYLSRSVRRDWLIAGLLLLGGLGTSIMSRVETVAACVLLALANGVASAWPEFLLGLTLLDQALLSSDFKTAAAQFQSEAATCRNLGSLVAHGILLIWMWGRELNNTLVTYMFLVTSLFHITGAAIALIYHVGTRSYVVVETTFPLEHNSSSSSREGGSYHSCSDEERPPVNVDFEEATHTTTAEDSAPTESMVEAQDEIPSSNNSTGIWSSQNARLVIFLQLTILLVALKAPLQQSTSTAGWSILISSVVGALLFQVGNVAVSAWRRPSSEDSWVKAFPRSHRVGLFLILRYALPSISYLITSFLYDVFGKTHPVFLTILSLWDMLSSSLATWSYGKLFSSYDIVRVLAGTTIAASLVFWLGNGALLRMFGPFVRDETSDLPLTTWFHVIATLLIKTMLTVTGEWKFLPDVILATTSAVPEEEATGNLVGSSSDSNDQPSSEEIGLRYGTLVACIDFGGQLGSLLAGPIVAAVGTSRENNWEHMDILVELSAVATMASLVFLVLLR